MRQYSPPCSGPARPGSGRARAGSPARTRTRAAACWRVAVWVRRAVLFTARAFSGAARGVKHATNGHAVKNAVSEKLVRSALPWSASAGFPEDASWAAC